MQLKMESRPVGDVFLIQCHGRIVAGNEVYTLHAHVGDSIAKYGDVVLQLDGVEFIDSSGLGAMVRLIQEARTKGGDLKFSGVPEKIRKTIDMTRLLPQFETYDSVEEAITAAYLGSRYSRGKAGDARPRVLCIYESTDVCTFLREILCSAGFNAVTTISFDDARILFRALKPKLVLVSARMQSASGRPVQKLLREIDPEVSILILDENFATKDPGEAAEDLLNRIGSPEEKSG